jgi:hypothetical protein
MPGNALREAKTCKGDAEEQMLDGSGTGTEDRATARPAEDWGIGVRIAESPLHATVQDVPRLRHAPVVRSTVRRGQVLIVINCLSRFDKGLKG